VRSCIAVFLTLFLFCSGTAWVQQTPPSLDVTMKFIQDKMNAVGRLDYSISFHNSADNKNWVERLSDELTNVVADPASCRLRFHERFVSNDKERFSGDDGFDLRKVQNVMVLSVEQDLKRHGEHPTWERNATPEVWSVWVECSQNKIYSLYFRDEEMAKRVARAMNHAVELCGGKKKAEPF
jgi:hypothetical protein